MDLISLVLPCFNDGRHALATVQAVGRLVRPEGCRLEAIVIDDASTDDSAAVLEASLPPWSRVVVSQQNLGRGGAINLGVETAKGQWLLMLDSDCAPAADGFLLAHFALLAAGADASIGDIHGFAEGFWGRYQSTAGERRAKAARSGSVHGLTTANVMIRTEMFRTAGGFDPRYRHYGFEDRDFLLRLHRAGAQLRHAEDAAVIHAANLDLPGICRKMHECGWKSAPLFRNDHPEAYRELGYAAIDAALHPHRAELLSPLARTVVAESARIERWLNQGRLPYSLRAKVARIVTALAYLQGTRAAPSTASSG